MPNFLDRFLSGKAFKKKRGVSKPNGDTVATPAAAPPALPASPMPLPVENGNGGVLLSSDGSVIIYSYSAYQCKVCDKKFPLLLLTCPNCGRDGSIEFIPGDRQSLYDTSNESMVLSRQNVNGKVVMGFKTGIEEVDKVVGEAIQGSAVILFGGRKGFGKSTFVMQVAQWLSKEPKLNKILYFYRKVYKL